MKIILIKDVRHVGVNGDIKDVADGYAINFLIPRKLAEPATEEKIKQMEAQKEARAAEALRAEEEVASKLRPLHGKSVTLSLRATEKGGLFKAVSAGDIVRAIAAQLQVGVPEECVECAEPIKTVGEHTVQLKSKNAKAELGVVVSAA